MGKDRDGFESPTTLAPNTLAVIWTHHRNMHIDIKTGNIQLCDKQISAFDKLNQITNLFPSIQYDGDYQDITFFKLADILTFENYEFRIHLSFKCEILYKISINLTENSINKIESNLSTFNNKLLFVKDLFYLFIAKTTLDDSLLKKSKTKNYDWGYLALNNMTGKWPSLCVSYNYDRIKELIK